MYKLMICRTSSKLDHVGSKSRSLGQIEGNFNALEATFSIQSSRFYIKIFAECCLGVKFKNNVFVTLS